MAESIEIQPDEKILLKLRKHWIILARDTGATFILAVLPFVLFSIIGLTVSAPFNLSSLIPFAAFVGSLWLLLTWLTLMVLWTNYYLDLWIVTDRRIISVDQINLFNRKVTSLALDSIQEITVRTENPLEAIFHYGTIEIETAGPDDIDSMMEGIPNPEKMRNVILEQANMFQKLLEANQSQEQLLHTVSHEVKNYLAKDAAALASIVEGDYDKEPAMLKSVAGSALSEARKGVKAVMGLLDSNGLQIEAAPFDLRSTVQQLARESEVAAQKHGLSFEVTASLPAVINGDEEKLGRLVIKNLLDNAIHYTPGGSIKVTLEKDGAVVRLSIADTGVGLSEEDMEHLFTPGGKGAESSTINPESTGYGLAIAKQVVEAHGGRIWAESGGKGQGSTFIVELPAA
jgi:signal transduction histidine kinase